jgi:hypothetical protein
MFEMSSLFSISLTFSIVKAAILHTTTYRQIQWTTIYNPKRLQVYRMNSPQRITDLMRDVVIIVL